MLRKLSICDVTTEKKREGKGDEKKKKTIKRRIYARER